jgi:hypothetical protein
MDEHGEVKGIVKLTFTGAPALSWRHRSLEGDTASFNHELKKEAESILPGGVQLDVVSIENLSTYEQPLIVHYSIKGPIGAPTGKRLFVPGDLFVSNEKAKFPHEKREIAIDFRYPSMVQDAVRIKLPANLKVESIPAKDQQQFQKYAVYNLMPESTADSITIRRNLIMGEILFLPKEYPELRSFYNKLETKDQENIVLSAAPAASAPAAKPAGAN